MSRQPDHPGIQAKISATKLSADTQLPGYLQQAGFQFQIPKCVS